MSVFVVILLLGVGICQAFTACDSVAGNGIACSCFNASSCATAQASDDVFFQLHNSGNPAVTSCSTATGFRNTDISGDCKTQSNTCAFKVTTANRLIYGRDCRDTAQEFKIQSICCVVPASAPTSTTSETTGASLVATTTTTTTTAAATTTATSSVATTTRAADTAPATRLSVGTAVAVAIAIALALVFVHY
jgi:peptidoglycan DL-endopeptidase CwlO